MELPLGRTVGQFLRKLINMLLSYNAAITFLGIYPEELQTYIHTEICMWIFVAGLLFIIAKSWR